MVTSLKKDMEMKHVLVTGGAGYIGSHCVLSLLEKGYEVVVVDNLSNSVIVDHKTKPESLIRVENITGKNIKFYRIDILDTDGLEFVFKQHTFDAVIHFAGLKAVSESVKIPLRYYANNVEGSIGLFQTMEKYNVTNLIFSSSSTVYGTPQFLPITENHPTGINCTNPYGKSKHYVEDILKDTCTANNKWNAVSLRYFNPIGAHKSGEIGEDPLGIPNNLMPIILQVAIKRRKFLKIYGNDYETIDGTGVRDYIHISDLVEGHIQALKMILEKKSISSFNAYNLGTGRGYSVLEVVKVFEEACGCKIPYEVVARRPGDIASSYCDASLARVHLDWKAKFNIHDMCRDAWRWQKKNPNGYRKIRD